MSPASFKLPQGRSVVGRSAILLGLSGIASSIYFVASIVALLNLPVTQFAQLSIVLMIGAAISASLQAGSTIILPETAYNSSYYTNEYFSALIKATLLCGFVLIAISILIEYCFHTDRFLSFIFIYAASLSTSIVSDAHLKAKGKLFLSVTSMVCANVLYLMAVIILYFSDLLTVYSFVITISVSRFVITITVMLESGIKGGFSRSERIICYRGYRRSLISSVTYLMANFDVLLLSPWVDIRDVALYLTIRHFAYGLYIALVQEGLFAIFLVNKIRGLPTMKSQAFIVFCSIAAFFSAFVLCTVVSLTMSAEAGRWDLPFLVSLVVAIHCASVSSIFAYHIFSTREVGRSLMVLFMDGAILAVGILLVGAGAKSGLSLPLLASILFMSANVVSAFILTDLDKAIWRACFSHKSKFR